MKKYLSLSLILISSFLLSACESQDPNSNNQVTENNNAKKFSLRELISQNIPQKCTYSGSNEEGSFNSEIIISGQKFNQTITYKSAEGEEKMNSISDGEYVYTWGTHSTGGAFATKLKADFNTQTTPETEDDQESVGDVSESSVDLDTDYQGSCVPVTVSNSDFQPPKDINFQDYSKFLDDLKSSIPSIDTTDLE